MDKKLCITQMLLSLSVGETMTFPIEKHASVRATCYNISLTYDRLFTTKAQRTDRVITVTRTA